jgi:hypothetical protein
LAWQTITYALSSASGFASGDTLYIAPGVYTTQVFITITNPTVETNIVGDPTCINFVGLSAGPVIVTNYNSTLTAIGYGGDIISATTKNYLHFQNLQIRLHAYRGLNLITCTNIKLTKCAFISRAGSSNCVSITSPTSTPVNTTINRCIFYGSSVALLINGQNVSDNSTITNSIFLNWLDQGVTLNSAQAAIINCTFSGRFIGVYSNNGSLTFPTTVRNCLFFRNEWDLYTGTVSNTIIENYNRLLGGIPRTNVADNLTSTTTGDMGVDVGETLLVGLNNAQVHTSYNASPNRNFGNITGAPATDLYGVTWTGTSPDAGSGTFRQVGGVGYYAPTERNSSSVTISPNATSKTLHLYLGATGLAYNTSGLSARFTRSGSNSVAISLVSQTSNGAWLSGGFAEIDAINQPGLYRLDVPNAAFVSGVDRVTVTVRGASGTNGAVVDCQLISSQLDLTQAVPTSNTANTIGDCLNAARAQGFGKWTVTGTTLRLYAPDGTTVVRTFTLDSETSPSQRV